MKPPPEPPWRRAAPALASSDASYQFVDSGPQDLSPTWYMDRMPTWKRDLAYQPVAYVSTSEPVDWAEPDEAVVVHRTTDRAASEEAPSLAAWDHAAAAQQTADAAQAAQAPAGAPDAAEQQDEPAESDPAAAE
jgi:hypothetical protein